MSQTPDSPDGGMEMEVEWALRWRDGSGSVSFGVGGRADAVDVARIYGYGTPDSKVLLVCRTVTRGPWVDDD